jgi:putative ABC transport system permease protein
VSGIFDAGKKGFDTSNILFHQKYFEEARVDGSGMIGWYIISVENPDRATEIATRLDQMFANSPHETKTSTEATFLQGFADQVGDIGAIFTAIIAVVFFTLLLVSGNTMAQSVRERTSDFAIMNIVGFRRSRLAMLVIGESLLLALLGGLTGLGLAKLWVTVGGDPTGGFLPAFYIPNEALVTGVALVVMLGVVAGLLPAIQTLRQNNLEAIRKVI